MPNWNDLPEALTSRFDFPLKTPVLLENGQPFEINGVIQYRDVWQGRDALLDQVQEYPSFAA